MRPPTPITQKILIFILDELFNTAVAAVIAAIDAIIIHISVLVLLAAYFPLLMV